MLFSCGAKCLRRPLVFSTMHTRRVSGEAPIGSESLSTTSPVFDPLVARRKKKKVFRAIEKGPSDLLEGIPRPKLILSLAEIRRMQYLSISQLKPVWHQFMSLRSLSERNEGVVELRTNSTRMMARNFQDFNAP